MSSTMTQGRARRYRAGKNEKRPHFTIEKMRLLDPSTVYSYEHAGHAGESLPARCTHLYVIKDGLIVRDDFVVFFPGKE